MSLVIDFQTNRSLRTESCTKKFHMLLLFLDKFDKYDPRDIERFNGDDAYTKLFLRKTEVRGDPAKALQYVHESLAFRKEYEINGKI